MTILERPQSSSSSLSSANINQNFEDTAAAAVSSVSSTLAGMISSMGDRYITPEYLAPLPPTSSEKSGKSPLQLLAQTCSQIGADTGSNKLLSEKSNGDNNKKSNSNNSNGKSPNLIVTDPKPPVSFKPYENNSNNKSNNNKASSVVSLSSPNGSTSSGSSSVSPKNNIKTPSPKSTTEIPRSGAESTPVIRSGMEVLHGNGNFRLDHQNPAFRSPFSYPPTSLAAAAAVCRDPYCRDPGCPTAVYNAQLAAALASSPGYAELLQAQKLGFGLPGMPPPPAMNPAGGNGPYVCNWMNGRDGYCGKRHSSAEELLQHLRTHTNLSTSDSPLLSSSPSSLYPPLFSTAGAAGSAAAAAAAGLHRTYGSLASASSGSNRFHPYGKSAMSMSAAAMSAAAMASLPSPYFPSPAAASMSALYNPAAALYALYGSRLSGAGAGLP